MLTKNYIFLQYHKKNTSNYFWYLHNVFIDIDKNNLPDDPELLKGMLAEIHSKYSDLEDNYESLEENYKYLQKLLYGKKNEKLTEEDEHQMRLFNKGEDGFEEIDEVSEEKEEQKYTTTVKSYSRKKAGRKPIPDWYPRKDIMHDLSEEEKRLRNSYHLLK